MQSLDYKLKTSNTSYVTARHDVQYFPSSLSSFSPTTSRVCRIPLTSGTSFIDPESIKIAFRRHQPAGPGHAQPRLQRVQVFANGQRCDDINYYGRTVAVHDRVSTKWATRASPARCTRAATRTCCCAPPWWASCAAGRCCRCS